MSCIKTLLQKYLFCSSSNNYTVGAPKNIGSKMLHPQKTQKLERSEWWVINLIQMMCNQNENITGIIYSSLSFAIYAQISFSKTLGGAMDIQKDWIKWTVRSWLPVWSSIIPVLIPLVSMSLPLLRPILAFGASWAFLAFYDGPVLVFGASWTYFSPLELLAHVSCLLVHRP